MFWTGAATKAKQRWRVTETRQNRCSFVIAELQTEGMSTEQWNKCHSCVICGGMYGYFKGRLTKYTMLYRTVRVSSVEFQSVPSHFALLVSKTHS